MSLSSMKNRVILYYRVLGEKHNYKELSIKDFNNQYNISKNICDKVFKKMREEIICLSGIVQI